MPQNLERVQAAIDGIFTFGINVLGPRVLVLRDESEAKTPGGLVIPDMAQKRKRSGTVIALGTTFKEVCVEHGVQDVHIGDRVTFNAYDGVEHDLDTRLGLMEVVAFHVGNLYLNWVAK